MSTQPTPTAARRCPKCGEGYATKGPARRLEAEDVDLGRYYRHTHAGRVFLHEIEWFDHDTRSPVRASELEGDLE